MNTAFRHAGDRGDIIVFCPVIRHHGGGILYIEAAPYTREFLVQERWAGLDLILKQQPYIVDVLPWTMNQRANINGNDFRMHMHRALRNRKGMDKCLTHWACDTHAVPYSACDEAWIKIDHPVKVSRIVINRSGAGRIPAYQYYNHAFPWRKVWDKYHNDAVFVGLPEEHAQFCGAIGDIAYQPTENLYEAARVIAGCDLFIGNQSVCFWLAEAMKKRILLEVWPQGPNCLIHREGMTHGWDLKVQLPDL